MSSAPTSRRASRGGDDRERWQVSWLYIVHSSKDRAAAVELKERLEAKGYRSAFLDCDPEHGIELGRDWEKELYANMRRCRAAIVICSPNLRESKWCFAEIAHCKALGKEILPLRIAADADHPLLHAIQAIDVAEGEQAYERLWRRLEGEALWPANRPPYPGLRPFDERDAPVFLGRRDEVRDARQILNRLQLFGAASGLLVIGPSGSGKSSLVRAGLVPDLRRDEDHWLIVGPWRPLDDPRATLISAVAAAFQRYTGSAPSFVEIDERLRAGLAPLCRELRLQAQKPEATVVVIVDQMEELVSFRAGQGHVAPGDWPVPIEPGASGFLLLGTLRSDFLGALLSDPGFQDVSFESFVLRPVSRASFADVIEVPAALSGLEIEPGLTATMTADAAGDDALPLLAYSLRELWDRYGPTGRFTSEQYRDLGGVGGSIRRAAEAAIGEAALDENDETLRMAFLRLASVNDQGDYIRRVARWDEIPRGVQPLLERLVRARLLVSRGDRDGRTVEVSHEALFRAWHRLARWLRENREFLLWRRRFEPSLHEWERTGRHSASALRGPSLGEARAWLDRNAALLHEEEIAFIHEGIRIERREQEAALELAERSRSAAIAMTASAVADPLLRLLLLAELPRAPESLYPIGAALDALMTSLPYAVERHETGVVRAAINPAGDLIATGTEDGEVRVWQPDGAESQTLRAGDGSPNGDRVVVLAFSAGGDRLLEGHRGGRLSLWDVARRTLVTEAELGELEDAYLSADGMHAVSVARRRVTLFKLVPDLRLDREIEEGRCATFSPDGSRWAVGLIDGSILTAPCNSADAPTRLSGHSREVTSLAFNPEGTALISGSLDSTARVWRVDSSEESVVLRGHEKPVTHVGFISMAGLTPEVAASYRQACESAGQSWPWSALLTPLTQDTDSICRTWSLGGDEPIPTELERGALKVFVAENDTQQWRAFAFLDGRVRLEYGPRTAAIPRMTMLRGADSIARDVALDPGHGQLVTAAVDGLARLWRIGDERCSMLTMEHPGEYIWSASFDRAGRQVVTTGSDKTARVWSIEGGREPMILSGHQRPVITAAFSPEGTRIVSGSKDKTARLWDLHSGDGRLLSNHDSEVSHVAFSPDGRWVVTCAGGDVAVTDTTGAAAPRRFSASFSAKQVVFAPDSKSLAIADGFGRLDIHALAGDRPAESWPKQGRGIERVVFSPDGRILAVALFEGGVLLEDLHAGKPLGILHHVHAVPSVAFDADGGRLATACLDGKVRIWHIADLERGPRVLRGGLEGLDHVEFSADGRCLLTVNRKDEAHLWHSDRVGEPVRVPVWEHGAVRRARLSPNGDSILVQGDFAAYLLPLNWDKLRSALLRRTRVRLTKEERHIYLGETPS
jgi:WD40 repeat protein